MRDILENSRAWKGILAGYAAIHISLSKHYKKESCEFCNKKPPEVSRLEWANITGVYTRDRKDYIVLCPSCHRKHDLKKEFCKKGHPRINNIRYNNRGHIVCVKCEKEAELKYKIKCQGK